MLTKDEVTKTFINLHLEEDYNFLQDDLVKLANAFITAATPKIIEDERRKCVSIARAYNNLVADKIEEVRSKVDK
jgi:tellurite resistance protein